MRLILAAINHPKRSFIIAIISCLILMAFIPFIHIDTDPENMLSEDESVRVMHNQLKEKYNMHDIIVLGIINDKDPNGVFNKSSLTKVYNLTEFISGLQIKEKTGLVNNNSEGELEIHSYSGVIKEDIMAPSNIDHIEPIAPGTLKFDWLMSGPPKNDKEALEIKDKLMSNDMFKNTIVSEDGKAICIYVPISSKDISYDVSSKIQKEIEKYEGDDKFHITGLPVAEDTFGTEMFIQMAITAPAAMICIFFLMFFFFKKIKLIFSPMIIAMISVICTMGLLIATGNTVHIMSSMIPIFVMPIAVLDSVHILSEFFDKYKTGGNKRETIIEVMHELYRPMLFTSLTSAAGFASLALTPIPPVQVFGIFVAFGILLAWLLTITLIPAYIILLKEESLKGFGNQTNSESSILNKFLKGINRFTNNSSRWIIGLMAVLFALSMYGITQIQINDNPVKWFTKDHPIRVADKELNEHFGGTYMAYLSLSGDNEKAVDIPSIHSHLTAKLDAYRNIHDASETYKQDLGTILSSSNKKDSTKDYYSNLSDQLYDKVDYSETDEEMEFWEEILSLVELDQLSKTQIFKTPEVLDYTIQLENHLMKEGGVGKINSLSKLIKKINKELHEGSLAEHKLPDNLSGVGQCVLSYQNSHLPERLRHCVDPDFSHLNLWLQLKSGDNKDMEKTIAAVDQFFAENPPPTELKYDWFGLTYINVIWQQKMVQGMLKAFLGSFLVVFLMMTFLFRSVKWALICMLPLSFTIAMIYGVIGFIGKDYDMPVAVLSSLALGLAIDFSIHFLVRARQKMKETGTWESASGFMFGEPSRAISRNVIVIAIGFLPLLFSSLVPYKTVGLLLASILSLSGLVTLILLPAILMRVGKYMD